MSELTLLGAAAAATGVVAHKLLGPTLETMGKDINEVYKANRDKIFAKAARKVANLDDGATANARVARDVLWNGVTTDDEIYAEYSAGILASSRSPDGRNDSAIPYVDCIKALSSKQMHLHYILYNAVHKLLLRDGKTINPGMEHELRNAPAWFSTRELTEKLSLNPMVDLSILYRQGLIGTYASNQYAVDDKSLPFTWAAPTTFGVLLYAAAHNFLDNWHQFGIGDFPESPDVKVPAICASSLEELCRIAGVPYTAPGEAAPA